MSVLQLQRSYDESFPLHYLKTRSGSSPGLWMAILIPLACIPGLSSFRSSCQPSPCTLALLALQIGISSIHLLHRLCQKAKRHHSRNDVEEKENISQFYWVATHPLLPPLITMIALVHLTDLNLFMAFLCTFACQYFHFSITEWIIINFGGSFSLGEALLVGQSAALSLTLSIKGLFIRPEAFLEYQQLACFVQVAVLTASALGLILWKYRFHVTMRSLIPLVLGMCTFGVCVSSLMMYEYSPIWLFHTVASTPTRIGLAGWWANISILIVLITSFSQRTSTLAKTVVRKIFHILMVLLLIPGVLLDPALTYLASTGAMILFTLLEFIRIIRVEPLSTVLSEAFSHFLDEKDGGQLILSHLYLLAGLICPLWLYPCSFQHIPRTENSIVPLNQPSGYAFNFLSIEAGLRLPVMLPFLSGILSVGIGDTMASVGGTYIGMHRWWGTNKTIEGSLMGMLFQLCFLWLGVFAGILHITWPLWGKFFIGILICSLVEAFTDQVDNVALPLLLYTPLWEF